MYCMTERKRNHATPERKRKTRNHATNTITPERVSTPITRQHTGASHRGRHKDTKNDLYTQGDV